MLYVTVKRRQRKRKQFLQTQTKQLATQKQALRRNEKGKRRNQTSLEMPGWTVGLVLKKEGAA